MTDNAFLVWCKQASKQGPATMTLGRLAPTEAPEALQAPQPQVPRSWCSPPQSLYPWARFPTFTTTQHSTNTTQWPPEGASARRATRIWSNFPRTRAWMSEWLLPWGCAMACLWSVCDALPRCFGGCWDSTLPDRSSQWNINDTG